MTVPTLVTGAAGFIGFQVALRLLREKKPVVGVDAFTPYYNVGLKEARFAEVCAHDAFVAERLDLTDEAATRDVFHRHRPARVVHLAAQPGVRRALVEPAPYVAHNVVAFLNVLEACRHGGVEHLVYASSSSVYGANRKRPSSEHDGTAHPVSLYAATKRANEGMAHAYAHLFALPATGLRLFTVYGPWGRPDMAVYAFTHAIAQGRPIEVSNGGRVLRDFTYVEDVVEAVLRVCDRPPRPDPAWNAQDPDPATAAAPHRVYNLGNGRPEALNDLITFIETALGRRATRIETPLPPGDVVETGADMADLERDVGFRPATALSEGVRRFVDWYRSYHA